MPNGVRRDAAGPIDRRGDSGVSPPARLPTLPTHNSCKLRAGPQLLCETAADPGPAQQGDANCRSYAEGDAHGISERPPRAGRRRPGRGGW